MHKSNNNISKQIDHLFRYEYGKLVSVLTKVFGTSNIQLAEDVVQEAMLEALQKWSYSGVPDNPIGWIYKVAKNKALNLLQREKFEKSYVKNLENQLEHNDKAFLKTDEIFTNKEIADDQLRMIFTCCHPSISSDSQIALTLKTLCGFSVSEIAKAFLTNEENIKKRLSRAKKIIRETNIPFEVPTGNELKQRLSIVLETIYLLFNKGYNASSSSNIIKYEVCEEAVRLAEIIISNSNIKSSNTYALLALMLLNSSRFKSRLDDSNNIIDLEHQDRGKWNQRLIKKGISYLEFATQQNEVSNYHILATISAQYCTAPNYESTDWKGILSLYDFLIQIDKSPIILLNRAIVLSKTSDSKSALEQLELIKENPAFQSYLPYFTTKAELHFQNNQPKLAIKTLNNALELPLNKHHKSFINSKLNFYSKNN